MTDKIEAWAVLDMDGGALHSVHIFKEDAEKAAWGLGSAVKMILDKNEEVKRKMKRYNFIETGMGYKRMEEDPNGEFVKYEDAAKLAKISPKAWAIRESIEKFEDTSNALIDKPYPDLLSQEENKRLLIIAEWLCEDLRKGDLGGFSEGNKPFWVLNEFRKVIEEFGKRDTGYRWPYDLLKSHPDHKEKLKD